LHFRYLIAHSCVAVAVAVCRCQRLDRRADHLILAGLRGDIEGAVPRRRGAGE
jgi:hypothetical protein